MSIADRWLLPDGVKEILPAEARQIEAFRRKLLNLFDSWGYDLVMPPMIEYLESLLTGTGYRPAYGPDDGAACRYHAAGSAYRCA